MVTTMTPKGLLLIPATIRSKYNMKNGSQFSIIEKDDQIILQPLSYSYFKKTAGSLPPGPSLSKALLKERHKDKKKEDEL